LDKKKTEHQCLRGITKIDGGWGKDLGGFRICPGPRISPSPAAKVPATAGPGGISRCAWRLRAGDSPRLWRKGPRADLDFVSWGVVVIPSDVAGRDAESLFFRTMEFWSPGEGRRYSLRYFLLATIAILFWRGMRQMDGCSTIGRAGGRTNKGWIHKLVMRNSTHFAMKRMVVSQASRFLARRGRACIIGGRSRENGSVFFRGPPNVGGVGFGSPSPRPWHLGGRIHPARKSRRSYAFRVRAI